MYLLFNNFSKGDSSKSVTFVLINMYEAERDISRLKGALTEALYWNERMKN